MMYRSAGRAGCEEVGGLTALWMKVAAPWHPVQLYSRTTEPVRFRMNALDTPVWGAMIKSPYGSTWKWPTGSRSVAAGLKAATAFRSAAV